MQLYIISALTGDYTQIAEALEEELSRQAHPSISPEFIDRLPASELNRLCKGLTEKVSTFEQENELLKEELNELYVRYDELAAAFGEMHHLITSAAVLANNHKP